MNHSVEPGLYRVTVRGHLDDDWSDYFGGLQIVNEPDGTATLTGALPDQAALHAVLLRIRDLGLPLIGVTRVDGDDRNRHAQ